MGTHGASICVPRYSAVYQQSLRGVFYTIMYAAYMLPTHTGGFSLGDLPRAVLAEMTPRQATRQPSSPVELRVRPLATASRVLFATGRYLRLVEQTFHGGELHCIQISAGDCSRTMYSNMMPGCWRTELDGVLVDLSQHHTA